MAFEHIKTEEDIEKLKKLIIKDPVFSARLDRARTKMHYPNDGVLHTDARGVSMRMPTKAEMLALYRELVEEGVESVNPLAERALRDAENSPATASWVFRISSAIFFATSRFIMVLLA